MHTTIVDPETTNTARWAKLQWISCPKHSGCLIQYVLGCFHHFFCWINSCIKWCFPSISQLFYRLRLTLALWLLKITFLSVVSRFQSVFKSKIILNPRSEVVMVVLGYQGELWAVCAPYIRVSSLHCGSCTPAERSATPESPKWL